MQSESMPSMETLLPHYERELALLRHALRTFADRYPKIAARLSIHGDSSEDPHVERMIQSFALLGAKLDARLDDDYPVFTESVVDLLHPHYLRPFPACAVAKFRVEGYTDRLTGSLRVPRGTPFTSHVGGLRFRSTQEVWLTPLQLSEVRYVANALAPGAVTLPHASTGVLSLSLAITGEAQSVKNLPDSIRAHLAGQSDMVAALLDGLLLNTVAAYVEFNDDRVWKRLPCNPVTAAGFEDTARLLDGDVGEDPSMSLLLEYFAFPDRFNFVDIDITAARRAPSESRKLTLHFAMSGMHPDSRASQRMTAATADNIRFFCTPVINLFDCEAFPIDAQNGVSRFPLVPQATQVSATAIWSINAVRPIAGAPGANADIPPFSSLRHGGPARHNGPFWAIRRDERVARERPGFETEIALVSLDGSPATIDARGLNVALTCTNRNLPASLPAGAELSAQAMEPQVPLELLRRPVEKRQYTHRFGALWKVIAHLAAQPMLLSHEGLPDLKDLFRILADVAGTQAPHVEGILSLRQRPTLQWISSSPQSAFVRGLEITLVIDETVFAGASVATFAGVMERFFASYVSASSFIQVVIVSGSLGREIRRCAPRPGSKPLL